MKLGLKNIKAVTHIAYTADEPPDYWAQYGYIEVRRAVRRRMPSTRNPSTCAQSAIAYHFGSNLQGLPRVE
jgi:DMSO/TMAO reductase YedYZ molybdopterin-dependent catalytic subunit